MIPPPREAALGDRACQRGGVDAGRLAQVYLDRSGSQSREADFPELTLVRRDGKAGADPLLARRLDGGGRDQYALDTGDAQFLLNS